jgi:hypothetical protein
MLNNRSKRRGNYAPLSSRYYMDTAIIKAGPTAECLYLRGLAYAAESMTDGFISDEVVRTLAVGLLHFRRTSAALVREMLWLRDDECGGYRIRSWLDWNMSAKDITAAREADASRKRSKRSGRNPDGVRADKRQCPDGLQPSKLEREGERESSDRTPPGPVRSEAPGVRGRVATGDAPRPPENASWRELNDPARRSTPPDLSALKRKWAANSLAARNGVRHDPFGELTRLTAEYGPESDAGGTE